MTARTIAAREGAGVVQVEAEVLGNTAAGAYRHLTLVTPGLPEIAPLIRPRLSLDQMRRYRYQLCLAGFDVGTNFVWAAQSNAVVLKEEAGWEAEAEAVAVAVVRSELE